MPDLKPLSPLVSAGAQLRPEDMQTLSEEGFSSIINNRPDDEEHGQPASDELQVAAQAAGLAYLHAAVRGLPDDQVIAAVAERLKATTVQAGRTAMFCRSGMRSAATWALAQRRDGVEAEVLRQAAADAGFDLSRLPL
ncbi:TIGR01244 family sulfur transferase [Brevundimonas sp.]